MQMGTYLRGVWKLPSSLLTFLPSAKFLNSGIGRQRSVAAADSGK